MHIDASAGALPMRLDGSIVRRLTRQILGALALLVAADAPSAVVFNWAHSLRAMDETAIPAGQLAFQVEYAVNAGNPQYIDIPRGHQSRDGAGTYTAKDLSILCEQTITARLRALWSDVYSDWSLTTQEAGPDCPQPTAPDDFVMKL